GFHPELTGRENIFLNGSILGLSRAEMKARLDEIVAFAGLEQFIDMPVKHYSSGMYMRLGFAVATSVDPDVLVTDEILAVGDYAFQRRCFDRVRRLRKEGVTVVLVSHSLGVVRGMCDQVLWLDKGRVRMCGPSPEVVDAYETEAAREGRGTALSEPRPEHGGRWGSREAEITAVEFLQPDGRPGETFIMG